MHSIVFVIAGEKFFEITVEDARGKVAEGSVLVEACGWFNVWDEYAVAFMLVVVMLLFVGVTQGVGISKIQRGPWEVLTD